MTIENAMGFFAWDVSAILAIILLVSMAVILADRVFFKKNTKNDIEKNKLKEGIYFLLFLKKNKKESYEGRSFLVRHLSDLYPVFLLVFVLRGFAYEPFVIPSNSMMPTLLTGDYIAVNKHAYGLKIPVLNINIIEFSKPERGDVVVFRYPNYEKNETYKGADFIKRIIGIPGDKIVHIKDTLYINNEKIKYEKIGKYLGVESGSEMTGKIERKENIGIVGSTNHLILTNPNFYSKGANLVVPDGHYFVMGDNRAYSSDSRYWGFVPEEYIIGKTSVIWMHMDKTLKIDRIGYFD